MDYDRRHSRIHAVKCLVSIAWKRMGGGNCMQDMKYYTMQIGEIRNTAT